MVWKMYSETGCRCWWPRDGRDRQTFPGPKSISDLQITQSVLQLCKFTKNHLAIHLKSVSSMVCKLYHNKDVPKNEGKIKICKHQRKLSYRRFFRLRENKVRWKNSNLYKEMKNITNGKCLDQYRRLMFFLNFFNMWLFWAKIYNMVLGTLKHICILHLFIYKATLAQNKG